MDTLKELINILGKSGFVGWPLVIGALLLWFGLGYRFVLLFTGDRRSVRALVAAAEGGRLEQPSGLLAEAAKRGTELARERVADLSRVLDEMFYDYRRELRKFSSLTQSVVRIAPLLGLLGTVAGMIATFDHLGDSSGANQGAGVAGGISEALFSTQLGLMVAIPGLLIGRLIDRRAQLVEDDLEKLRDVLASEHGLLQTPRDEVRS